MKFCLKLHNYKGYKILAVCDEEVLNKEFDFQDFKIKILPSFYFEKYVDENEIENLIKDVDVINIFGNKIVEFFIRKGFLKEKNVIIIGNQKHAIIQII